MTNETLKEIFSDEAFVKELFAKDTAAQVQSALLAKGVQITEQEILAIRDLLAKVEKGEITSEQLQQAENGELPDELLEQVSGGFFGIVVAVVSCISIVTEATCLAIESGW